MENEVTRRALVEVAALARIEELGGQMTTHETSGARATHEPGSEHKTAERATWALGDYHAFAKQTVWDVGPVLVAACGIGPGQRVLDVAAGTGNVALRAAEAGAQVTASDLTPENFEAGRREAAALGVDVEWVEADAEALPFADAEFDVVTSSFGAIFPPRHQKVADELLRVCKPGGTIGMANFAPSGPAVDFFETLAQFAPPPPPGAQSPLLWGDEQHVRELFGERVASLDLFHKSYVERSPGGPREYVELFKETFGPVIGLYDFLSAEPERLAQLDEEFLHFATRANTAAPGANAEYVFEYVLVVARR